jgi:hypothetical protein
MSCCLQSATGHFLIMQPLSSWLWILFYCT